MKLQEPHNFKYVDWSELDFDSQVTEYMLRVLALPLTTKPIKVQFVGILAVVSVEANKRYFYGTWYTKDAFYLAT